MSKIMNYLLEEAEQKFDGDFEEAQAYHYNEQMLAHMEWEKECLEKRIYDLEVKLGKREKIPTINFINN